MDLGKFGHLTYSTLVHPGDTWPEMWHSLTTYVPKVKARISPQTPFGVSLRLSAASAAALTGDAAERRKLKGFLDDNDMYLYTVNAFPYGPFKNTIVKEQVYEPDWRTAQRLEYTKQVADILAEVCPPFVNPSIQSPPLGFKARVTDAGIVASYAANVRHLAVHLHRLRERTGRTVTLALEPEPLCFLETTEETVAFFNGSLRSEQSITELAREIGGTAAQAREVLHRHVGTVYDICHQAVEFENIAASLQSLVDHDIPVFKLQEAAAMQIPEVTPTIVKALREYADSIYLTQTVQRKDGVLSRFTNLEDAFAAYEKDPSGKREWRTHFHVPVFLERLGEHFRTTRFAIEEALAFHRARPLSDQLEIETYTWDVLPEHLKTGDIVDYVTRELEWVRDQLQQPVRAARAAGLRVKEQGIMKHSVDRILTTHAGSLPRPDDLTRMMWDAIDGKPPEQGKFRARIKSAVAEMVQQQKEAGVDVISDGEMSKFGFSNYVVQRYSGFGKAAGFVATDLGDFPEIVKKIFANEGGAHLQLPNVEGPIELKDPDAVKRDIDNLKAALNGRDPDSAFIPSVTPGQMLFNFPNKYYKSDAEYLEAAAKAMAHEYKAIVAAGFNLQLDAPDLPMNSHSYAGDAGTKAVRDHVPAAIEAMNEAIKGLPPEKVRLHLCWGNYAGPHHHDIELKELVEPVLKTKAGFLYVEAANPRHEHEWEVWQDHKLPDGKGLIVGVIDVLTNHVEHPRLIAQRLERFANVIGKENVLAGTDCGFGTFVGWSGCDPKVAWMKLKSLSEGAAIASDRLWGKKKQ